MPEPVEEDRRVGVCAGRTGEWLRPVQGVGWQSAEPPPPRARPHGDPPASPGSVAARGSGAQVCSRHMEDGAGGRGAQLLFDQGVRDTQAPQAECVEGRVGRAAGEQAPRQEALQVRDVGDGGAYDGQGLVLRDPGPEGRLPTLACRRARSGFARSAGWAGSSSRWC